MQGQQVDLTGKRLYSPGVIAAYLVLSGLPVGLFLYGLNMRRRGQTILGSVMCTLSAIVLLGLLLTAVVGRPVGGFGIVAVFVAIAMVSIESSPYRGALQRGAVRAKWWPPAIGLAAIIVLVLTLAAVFGKEPVSQ